MDHKTCSRGTVIFVLPVAAHTWASTPVPFSTLFQTADTVLVGTLDSAKRIPQADARNSLGPEPSPALLLPPDASEAEIRNLASPWEFTVNVAAVIEAADPLIKPGSKITVMWYKPSAENYPDHYFRDGHANGQPALWLLRTERGVLRAVSDSYRTVFPLGNFSGETEKRQ
jgi:hypothetical protein